MFKPKPRIRAQKIVLSAIEDMLHYQLMVEFPSQNRSVGAYLLSRNEKDPLSLVFGFEFAGIHSFLSEKVFEEVFERLEKGLKDFPQARITFHLGAYQSH